MGTTRLAPWLCRCLFLSHQVPTLPGPLISSRGNGLSLPSCPGWAGSAAWANVSPGRGPRGNGGCATHVRLLSAHGGHRQRRARRLCHAVHTPRCPSARPPPAHTRTAQEDAQLHTRAASPGPAWAALGTLPPAATPPRQLGASFCNSCIYIWSFLSTEAFKTL